MRKLIVVPYVDNDGAINSITLATNLDGSYFVEKVNQADGSKRWYPLPEIKNINTEKADNVFETFDDGSKAFIREGVRSISGVMIKQGPEFLGKIKGYRCGQNGLGVYIIDENRGITGMISPDGTKLYPIKIDSPSWDAKYMPKKDGELAKVSLAFDWDNDMLDEDLRTITYDNLNGVNLLEYNGLIDANITYGAVGAEGLQFTLTSDYGDPKSPVKIEGIDLADCVLTNLTDEDVVTIDSLTESAPGVYDLVYEEQDAADVLQVTITKNGFDFSRLEDEEGTV